MKNFAIVLTLDPFPYKIEPKILAFFYSSTYYISFKYSSKLLYQSYHKTARNAYPWSLLLPLNSLLIEMAVCKSSYTKHWDDGALAHHLKQS